MARGIRVEMPPDKVARAVDMYVNGGLSTHKISLELGEGINQERVRTALIREGVEMRTNAAANLTPASREAKRRRRAEEEIARRSKP